MKVKYLIIGNSAGGIGAAEAIRQSDAQGTLAIISDEPYPAYSRPLISEYLSGECQLEEMLYRPAEFYYQNNIQALLGKKVRRLEPDNHAIELVDGQRITWEKLLLATGGQPIVPPTRGIETPGVFSFTTLDDAKSISRHLDGKSHAVVIGGGLIGISVTEALVKRGVKVTIVEMKDRILNTILDEEGSQLEEKALVQAGVRVVTAHTVTEISGGSPEGAITSVTLDDGSKIPCDMVVVAIGVRPRLELISGTGIRVNRGILVDRQMATSIPDIYACGDVAEAYDFIYGENRLTPIWPNAYLGGRTAGFNMAGTPTEYPGGTAMNSLKYFNVDVASAGMVITSPDDGCETLSRKYAHNYRMIILKDGLVVGMVFAGNIEKSGIVFNLMKTKVNVDSFKQTLLAEDFSLASLPRELWQSYLKKPAKELTSSTSGGGSK